MGRCTASEEQLSSHGLAIPSSPRQASAALPACSMQADGEEHPLKDVRYSALSAPGPSFTWPEHAANAWASGRGRLLGDLRAEARPSS